MHPLDRYRPVLAIACFAVAGGLSADLLLTERPAAASVVSPAPDAVTEVLLDGERAPLDRLDPAVLTARVAERWDAAELRLTLHETVWARSRRDLGATVDQPRLLGLLAAATDPDSSLRRHWRASRPGEATLALPVPFAFEGAGLLEALIAEKDRLDAPPVDARLDPRAGTVQPHTDGLRLDVHETLDALERALQSGAVDVPASLTALPARRTTDDLAGVDVRHVLGSYETRYSMSAEARDRTFNLRVAARKLDGLVLMPGEELDFNAVVGERSEANGFRPAPVIAQGELVDGVGGGTCQVAGTLHAAAFFAGLPILERSPHSRPSTYIYMGLDAVVSYPQLNLRLANDRPFPVAIGFTVEGGKVRVEVRGPSTPQRVSFIRRVDDITAYEEREVEDSSLPDGVRVLRQRGVPGFAVRTYRIVRDIEANTAVRTADDTRYPPTTQIWRVGTGGPAPEGYEPPPGDEHLEYTADEYLSVTAGAGLDVPVTARRAGRSGTYGWTERLGFPPAHPGAE